jgi:hypothetical protein
VIVRVLGGFGNQLFQYTAGRAFAHRHGVAEARSHAIRLGPARGHGRGARVDGRARRARHGYDLLLTRYVNEGWPISG